MELIIACLIITVGIITLVGSLSMILSFSAKSRNRVFAELMAKSTMDRIRAHHYGDPEPYNWNGQESIRFVSEVDAIDAISGNAVQNLGFTRQIQYDNGSLVGNGSGNFDKATITITWNESNAGRQYADGGEKNKGFSRLKALIEVRKSVPDQKESD